jgi:malate:Na+ symporter
MATGFFAGRRLGMYPIESAIVNACHSGQGGTGDIAILTAANRMQLVPFAQIATRIGGAITVTLTLILLAQLAWRSGLPSPAFFRGERLDGSRFSE